MGKKEYLQPFSPPDMISKTHMLTMETLLDVAAWVLPGPKAGVQQCRIGIKHVQKKESMVWQKVSIESTGGSYNNSAIPGASSTRLYNEQLNPAQLIES